MTNAHAQPYYGVDKNYEKSKDISKSISVNKIKCINGNLNINGENAGDVNVGNKGQVVEPSSETASSFGYGDERYYYNYYYY